jgi:hypothetical protein
VPRHVEGPLMMVESVLAHVERATNIIDNIKLVKYLLRPCADKCSVFILFGVS